MFCDFLMFFEIIRRILIRPTRHPCNIISAYVIFYPDKGIKKFDLLDVDNYHM